MMGMGFMGTGMILWWIVPVLLAVGFALPLKSATGSGRVSTEPGSRKPLEILQERYARGEIDRDEFLSRKKDLS
ncbi:MAG TPA: SHOCT domain-containing protein [Bacteroidetes bacterium]|nr:SHOCT domain-containing protein [Bacteroidota bacterium]